MRRAVEWTLDSPGRFASVVAGAVVVVAVALLAAPGPHPAPAARTPQPVPSTTVTAPPPSMTPTPAAVTTPAETETPTEEPPTRATVRAVAAGWVHAWLAGDRKTLAARSTTHLARLMRTATAPPATRIGAVRAVQASSTYALADVVLTDRDRLSVSMVLEPDGWVVSQVGSREVR